MMCSKVFLVENYQLEERRTSIHVGEQMYNVYGHLICKGEDHKAFVYFVDDMNNLPSGHYDADTREGSMFIKQSEKAIYYDLPKLNAPVYVYFNDAKPELNCVSVNEPMRDQSFFTEKVV